MLGTFVNQLVSGIVYGTILHTTTNGNIGIIETLFATGIMGIFYTLTKNRTTTRYNWCYWTDHDIY